MLLGFDACLGLGYVGFGRFYVTELTLVLSNGFWSNHYSFFIVARWLLKVYVS